MRTVLIFRKLTLTCTFLKNDLFLGTTAIRNKANVPCPSAWSTAYSTKLVVPRKRSFIWLWKGGKGAGSPFPPFPWQSELQVPADGGGRGWLLSRWAEKGRSMAPSDSIPPIGDHHSWANIAGEGHELQPTTTFSSLLLCKSAMQTARKNLLVKATGGTTPFSEANDVFFMLSNNMKSSLLGPFL